MTFWGIASHYVADGASQLWIQYRVEPRSKMGKREEYYTIDIGCLAILQLAVNPIRALPRPSSQLVEYHLSGSRRDFSEQTVAYVCDFPACIRRLLYTIGPRQLPAELLHEMWTTVC